MIKINCKSFECNPNGCGLLFTSPKKINDIVNEFINHKQIKYVKVLNSITEDGKLSQPNDVEINEYQKSVDNVIQREFDMFCEQFPKNKFELIRTIDGDNINHTFKTELVEAKIEESEGLIVLSCPNCGKEAYRVSR